jgi:hypothetical protein
MKLVSSRWIYVVIILCIVQVWEFCHWLSLYITINVDITEVCYIVLYFIYTLWVFRVLIWIVNWVWHVQCQTCDNVDWINGNEINWWFFSLTTGLFNSGRLQGVTGQKTTIWTQHHENFKLIKTVVFNEFCDLCYTLQSLWKLSRFWEKKI